MPDRKKLGQLKNQRMRFVATYEREGVKPGWRGKAEKTHLLLKVRRLDTEEQVADHLWLNDTKAFAALDLQPGVEVSFEARVTKYTAGYQGHDWEKAIDSPVRTSWRLSRPTQIELFKKEAV